MMSAPVILPFLTGCIGRTYKGIEKATNRGADNARKAPVEKGRIFAPRDKGRSTYKIANFMGMIRITVYRALK